MNNCLNVLGYALIFYAFLLITACSSSSSSMDENSPLSKSEVAVLDSIMSAPEWTIPKGDEQFLPVRTWDLHHQKIEISFDFENEEASARTTLFLKSLTPGNDTLVLDAKTITIDSAYYPHKKDVLNFQKDSARVYFTLDKPYDSKDSLFIVLEYTADPPGRGLYFVDPVQEDPTIPTQVWTLGKPQDNSYWLPTIDHPAERATQEMHITVPDSMTTVSNGRLLHSNWNSGNRTDVWIMEKPHAPYLFALAAGKFDVKKALNNGIFYRFYTEPHYTGYHELIYEPTVDIGRYLQKTLQVPYPWYIYQQVPVRNFTKHGMENTTASFLFDDIQFDSRASQDINNQDLIVHEFTHQWFGNLVTSKNWANLPLSEGFATYFEILYREHKQDTASADWLSYQHKLSYLEQAKTIRHPIIFNRYSVPGDMFDAHTYGKMSRILRMLHDLVGEEVWKASLADYLKKNAFSTVDYRDLQEVFERQYGNRLAWFFNQWLLQPGHPIIKVLVDTSGLKQRVRLTQTQDLDRQPVFKIPVQLQVVTESGTTNKQVWMESVDSTYQLPADVRIKDVIVDPEDILLTEVSQNIPLNTLISRLQHTSVAVRLKSLKDIHDFEWNNMIQNKIIDIARNDAFWGIRMQAMKLLAMHKDSTLLDFAYTQTYENEPEGRVRIYAIHMAEGDTTKATRQYLEKMLQDTSYFVAAEAIKVYGKTFPEDSYSHLKPMQTVDSYKQVIKSAYAQTMKYNAANRATGDLVSLALQPGEYQYIRDALRSLAVRVKQNLAEYSILLETCYKKLSDPYKRNRKLCLEIIENFARPNDITDLEFMKEERARTPEDINRLEAIIRSLKNKPLKTTN